MSRGIQIRKERRKFLNEIQIRFQDGRYLDENEIQKIIEAAPTLQKKAFLACMYESGSRPEEFLRLTNLDCKIDINGAIIILRGKKAHLKDIVDIKKIKK